MRLIVFVVLVLECCGILATQARLYVEIMGLAPALIYKILAQMQVPLLTRHPIQFHQRELDFFMPGVTAFLAWRGAKDGIDVVRIATQRIQQNAFTRGLKMRHRCFYEVTGTIQLVPVTQVRPALLRLNNGEIAIEIAIGLLSRDNKIDNFVNLYLQRLDVFYSVVKIVIFIALVTCIHCTYGFYASGGPEGVGRAVGRSVRLSVTLIFLVNFILSMMFWGGGTSVRFSG